MARPKVIVIEGADLSGKSTLADALARYYRTVTAFSMVTEWHFGPFTDDHSALDEYLVPLKRWYDHAVADEVLIIDRFHLGELVYGPMLRGKTKLRMWQIKLIEDFLTQIGASRILVSVSDRKILAQRYMQRHESLQLAQVLQAREDYLLVLDRWSDKYRNGWAIWDERHVGTFL